MFETDYGRLTTERSSYPSQLAAGPLPLTGPRAATV